ncbi:MAG: type II toxin-antitoxin system Phd/YefM family antitoxin [Oligoflexia bacterium]|nr:type II toxin-antitoxin system Phd/YefM family antitoxin [Oligoflexia bacterium]
MFRNSQIINRSELFKHFKAIARYLADQPQPILITHRSGMNLVLVNAEIFEDLLEFKLRSDGAEVPRSAFRDVICEPKI